jgi:hypothetical protein
MSTIPIARPRPTPTPPPPTAAPAPVSRDEHEPPKLSHDELVRAQMETLAAARRTYSLAARLLFLIMDLLYGRRRSLAKYRVLEIVARTPYQTRWSAASPRASRSSAPSRTTSSGTC